ncbi:hypothetical protein CCAX7_50370 [Capsulimonas corticalis]|uniref:Uncharacterized protein n=1 Tax=Capsulimonas corticalis TaxID=2219043 RepID=A0A402CPA6_9BACT|nr:hypothetical protein CCAX7_50370 [Capsulimonas corticalis]
MVQRRDGDRDPRAGAVFAADAKIGVKRKVLRPGSRDDRHGRQERQGDAEDRGIVYGTATPVGLAVVSRGANHRHRRPPLVVPQAEWGWK